MTGPGHDRAELSLPPDPRSASSGRAFVRAELLRRGADEAAADTATALISELVTNVVLHAHTRCLVLVESAGPREVRVSVVDGSPARVRQQAYGLRQSTGRGVRLVAVLSEDWGVVPSTEVSPAGKSVWFTVPLYTDPARALALETESLALFAVDLEGIV